VRKPIPDDILNAAISQLYNHWFRHWRSRARRMSDDDWDQCIREYSDTLHQYPDNETITRLALALLGELEARAREADEKGRETHEL
jgi:hypothetical protein